MEERIAAVVRPSLECMGYGLVRVLIHGKVRRTLQIMVERQDRVAMSVDDCIHLSQVLSAVLDVTDPIGESYILEVSSPGLDRPLTCAEDFVRFVGYETQLETSQPIEGRRRFRGRLLDMTEENIVRLVLPGGEVIVIPKVMVAKAKLVVANIGAAESANAKQREKRET